MIKLIASDLDGTLLLTDHTLPEEIFPLIRKMLRRGILFTVASGRQYYNLTELFAPVKDSLVYIAENGALVKYRGETLYENSIPKPLVHDALQAIRAADGLFPILCCEENAYLEDTQEPFYTHAVLSYTHCVRVRSLDEIAARERVLKVSVYDEKGSAVNGIRTLPEQLPDLRVILSGRDWLDISAQDANKGTAMRCIKQRFSLKTQECAAFGDHMNDYEMLLECGSAFVTENAYPPLKKLIPNTVPSNADGGVITAIKKLLKEGTL